MSPTGSDPDLLRRMAREIQRKQDIEQGLGVARRRQAVMLPSPPDIDGYEFACTYDPAADISGDFYDFVRLGDGRVGLLIGCRRLPVGRGVCAVEQFQERSLFEV